ncbi:MAG: dephospho-CoA kinase [Myxococcota bacterium]
MTRIVGLTGGIGSGKSTVARMFRARGAAIIDADVLAREAVALGSPGLAKVVERFGPTILGADGLIDRPRLGKLVFEDEASRRDLNAIVHPEVARLAAERMAALSSAGVPLILYDVPLLFENGLDRVFPETIVVTVPPEVQRARVAGRDKLSPADVEARIAAQMPLAEKVLRATWVIDNSGSEAETEARVDALWKSLQV